MLFAISQKAQGLVEYGLILALVSIFVLVLLVLVGPQIGNIFSQINSSLSGI
jgi:pilus assembly protein Flp/PilA